MAQKRPRAEVASAPAEPPGGTPGPTLLLPLLCLAGAGIAAYLSVVHYGVLFGNLSFGAVCGGAGSGDCNSVVASRFGQLASLPVSVWGLAYYLMAGALALGMVLLRPEDSPPLARALVWLTAAALAFDAYLAWAMLARLERTCWLCIATYAVNLAILALALLHRSRVRGDDAWTSLPPRAGVLANPRDAAYYRDVLKAVLGALAAILCVAAIAFARVGDYSAAAVEKARLARLIEFVRTTQPVEVPSAGRPRRGSTHPRVRVVVFSDFLCEQCRRANEYLDVVAANHRDDVEIVYRHLPSDQACNPKAMANRHPGACRLALAAECAYRQERFWPFHDQVYGGTAAIRPDRVPDYARRAGLDMPRFEACMGDTGAVMPTVRADIDVAHELDVDATPTLFVNGLPVVGALKPWMLEQAIRELEALETARSRR